MKKDWTYKKIGDCFSYIKNGANIRQEKNASGFPITRIETLSNGVFNRDRLGYADIFDLTKYAAYTLNDKDILMSHINSKVYIGRAVVYSKMNNETIIHGMNLLRLIPNEFINSFFAGLYFRTSQFKDDIAKIRKDAVNQSSFAISDLKNILIPVPSLEKQQQIVAELDLLSGMIEKQKAQIEELDKLSQSIFYDMFGDPTNNPKNFEVKPIDKVCLLKAGKAIKAEELSDYSEDLYPCFGGNGIRGYIDRFSHEGTFPIIGRQGALCGNVNLANGQFYATEHAVVVTPVIELDTIWLYYVLLSMRLGQYAHGVAQPGLSVKDINPLPIILPPLSLQQEFAAKIEAIEAMKAKVRQSLKESETLFNSRMDYYFN